MSRNRSRERPGRGGAGTPGRRAAPPGGGSPAFARTAWVALALLILVAVAAWALAHRGPRPSGPRKETLSIAVLMDSVRAAERAQDWPRSTRWFQRIADTEPTNPMYLLGLALAQNNLLWVGGADHPGRAAVRTSLDRIRMQRQVLALLDSAAALARSDDEWMRIRRWSGQAYENFSLPLDALQVYTEVRLRDPGYQPTIRRAEGQLRILRDPRALPATGMTQLPAATDETPR